MDFLYKFDQMLIKMFFYEDMFMKKFKSPLEL